MAQEADVLQGPDLSDITQLCSAQPRVLLPGGESQVRILLAPSSAC